MYRNILIATDGSELADKAVTDGLSLARQMDAAVTIVTVTAGEEGWENAAQHAAGRAVVMAGR